MNSQINSANVFLFYCIEVQVADDLSSVDSSVSKQTQCFRCKSFHTKTNLRHDTWCKDCRRSYYRAEHRANPEKARIRMMRRNYGLTADQYEDMRLSQGFCCAICGLPESHLIKNENRLLKPRLDIDHCHKTGRVRSLLCGHCNTVVGHIESDPIRHSLALEYVKQHGNK